MRLPGRPSAAARERPIDFEMTGEREQVGSPLAVETEVVVEAALPPDLDLHGLESVVAYVLGAERAEGAWQVTILLCDDDRLRRLHRDFLGLDSPTDVITFPIGDDGGELGGDIVVSVERAADQAGEYGHRAAEEVRFLVVHGLLHLCGWDDATEVERTGMLRRQTVLLAQFTGSVKGLAGDWSGLRGD